VASVNKTKTKITPELVKQVSELASKGYSNVIISDNIGIGLSTLSINTKLIKAIKEGRALARQKVVNDLMNRSEDDVSSTASIFLAKKLKVFDTPFPTSSPKSAEDATKKISNIYTAVAKGTLDSEKGTHLIGYLNSYIKAKDVSDYEQQLAELKEMVEGLKR